MSCILNAHRVYVILSHTQSDLLLHVHPASASASASPLAALVVIFVWPAMTVSASSGAVALAQASVNLAPIYNSCQLAVMAQSTPWNTPRREADGEEIVRVSLSENFSLSPSLAARWPSGGPASRMANRVVVYCAPASLSD